MTAPEINTHVCRLCDVMNGRWMIQYSTRHWAHGQCMIERWGADVVKRLNWHKLGQLPVSSVFAAGLEELVKEAIKEGEERASEARARRTG